MSLPYTSGYERPQETRIAEAIVARLHLLHRDQGLFLRYVGQAPAIPSRITDTETWNLLVDRMNTQAPAALVVIDSARTHAGGMNNQLHQWRRTYDVTIAVFSNHRRDTVAGRLDPDTTSRTDDSKDPGLRAMCELVDTLLLGFPLKLDDVYEVEPGRQGMQTVYSGTKGTLRELHYTVEAELTREPWPDPALYLQSIVTSLASAVGLTQTTEVT